MKTLFVIAALLLTSLPTSLVHAGSLNGLWIGEYQCRQGKTALALTIGPGPDGKTSAILTFSAHPENSKVPTGSYVADADIDAKAGTISLKPNRWLIQPSGYRMVAAKGKLAKKGRIEGQLVGAPGCTTFTVHRRARKSKLKWSKGIEGIWTGQYTCAQGKTAVAVTISRGGKKGVFQFAPYRKNKKTPVGLYRLRIKTGEKGAIKIDPADWRLRPSGYRKVGFEGKITGTRRISGKVTWLDGCKNFKLHR